MFLTFDVIKQASKSNHQNLHPIISSSLPWEVSQRDGGEFCPELLRKKFCVGDKGEAIGADPCNKQNYGFA